MHTISRKFVSAWLAVAITFAALVTPNAAFADPADVNAAARGVVRVVIIGTDGSEVYPVSHGTGFAITPTRIITNAHVVREALQDDTLRIGIVPSEGDDSAFAKVIAASPRNDLALIEIVGDLRLPPLTISGDTDRDSGEVSAVGYPMNVDLAQGLDMDDIFSQFGDIFGGGGGFGGGFGGGSFGGGGASGNRTTSSLLRVLNPDVTFTRLSGRGSHFQVSSKTITRESGVVYQSTPSECGGRLNGTAAGSVRVNGIFNQLQLRIEMNPDANAVANDRFEIAFSEVKEFTTDLKLTNVVSASLPKVGETIKYILEITNHGLYDVEGVVVLNNFPSLVAYAGAIGNGSYAPVSGEWNVGDLSIGQKKIIEISGIVNGSGEITSIAEVERVVLATDVDSEPGNSR